MQDAWCMRESGGLRPGAKTSLVKERQKARQAQAQGYVNVLGALTFSRASTTGTQRRCKSTQTPLSPKDASTLDEKNMPPLINEARGRCAENVPCLRPGLFLFFFSWRRPLILHLRHAASTFYSFALDNILACSSGLLCACAVGVLGLLR